MTRAALTVLTGLLAGPACYTYAPVEPGEITPEMTVRVELAEESVERRVEGTVFSVEPGALSVLPESRPGGDPSPRTLRFADVEVVQVRSFDSRRTALVVAAGAAVGIGVLLAAEGNPADTRGPGGGGDFNVLPLLRSLFAPD